MGVPAVRTAFPERLILGDKWRQQNRILDLASGNACPLREVECRVHITVPSLVVFTALGILADEVALIDLGRV